MQKQQRLENFLDSAYEFAKNNKNRKWLQEAISQMGLKEEWITKDQGNNRLVNILLFCGLLLLIIANILIVECYKGSLEMKKPNWIMTNGKIKIKFKANSLNHGLYRNGPALLSHATIIPCIRPSLE